MSVRRDTIRVSSSLREFYGVVVLHDYYKSIVCKDLSFEPTESTKLLLRNFNLLFRPFSYGFILLYNPAESPKLLLNSALKTRFSFIVKNKNFKFQNYTQIPFLKEGVSYHFSNLVENNVDLNVDNIPEVFYNFKKLNLGEKQKNLLHFSDHSELPVRPSKYMLNARQFPELDEHTRFKYIDIEIQDEWGESTFGDDEKPYKRSTKILHTKAINFVVRKELSKFPDLSHEEKSAKAEIIRKREEKLLGNYEASEIMIDLDHAPEGKYKILYQGKLLQEIYVGNGIPHINFGILDIHIDGTGPALVNRKEEVYEEVVQPKMQYMHFKARPTIWRYYFLNYPDSVTKPLSILDEKEEMEFTEPIDALLPGTGEKAILIESKEVICLAEKPDQYFFLQRKSGNRTLKEIRLPSPSPDMIKPIKVKDKTIIYSDIFVYL